MSHITGRHLWIIFRNALLSYFVKRQTVGPFVMKQTERTCGLSEILHAYVTRLNALYRCSIVLSLELS